jgi:hypothetical protein
MTRKKALAATGGRQGKEKILEIETRSTRSHSVENSLWKRWTCLFYYDSSCRVCYIEIQTEYTVKHNISMPCNNVLHVSVHENHNRAPFFTEF